MSEKKIKKQKFKYLWAYIYQYRRRRRQQFQEKVTWGARSLVTWQRVCRVRKCGKGKKKRKGWRIAMEDAHLAKENITDEISVFGVFDGHGGERERHEKEEK